MAQEVKHPDEAISIQDRADAQEAAAQGKEWKPEPPVQPKSKESKEASPVGH